MTTDDDQKQENQEDESSTENEEGSSSDQSTKTPWELWLDKQPEAVKKLYADNVTGLTSALDKERTAAKEAKKLAKKVAEYEAEADKQQKAKMTEGEKLKSELSVAQAALEKLQKEMAETRRKTAIVTTATRLGFADPSDAYGLLNLSELEIDETTGEPTNAEALLKVLLTKKPYLKGKTQQNGDGNQSRHDLKKKQQGEKAPVPVVKF